MNNKYKKMVIVVTGFMWAFFMFICNERYTTTADEKNTTVAAVVTTAPAPMGDVNLDGVIDLNDAKLALRVALGAETVSDAAVRAGDINGNGKIDLNDAKVILNWAIGNK